MALIKRSFSKRSLSFATNGENNDLKRFEKISEGNVSIDVRKETSNNKSSLIITLIKKHEDGTLFGRNVRFNISGLSLEETENLNCFLYLAKYHKIKSVIETDGEGLKWLTFKIDS